MKKIANSSRCTKHTTGARVQEYCDWIAWPDMHLFREHWWDAKYSLLYNEKKYAKYYQFIVFVRFSSGFSSIFSDKPHILTFLHIFPWIQTLLFLITGALSLDTLCLCDCARCSRLSWFACLLWCQSSLLIYLLLTRVSDLLSTRSITPRRISSNVSADVTIVRGHGI